MKRGLAALVLAGATSVLSTSCDSVSSVPIPAGVYDGVLDCNLFGSISGENESSSSPLETSQGVGPRGLPIIAGREATNGTSFTEYDIGVGGDLTVNYSTAENHSFVVKADGDLSGFYGGVYADVDLEFSLSCTEVGSSQISCQRLFTGEGVYEGFPLSFIFSCKGVLSREYSGSDDSEFVRRRSDGAPEGR